MGARASVLSNHRGLPATATNTDRYDHGQDSLPVVLNEPDLGITFNRVGNQLDLLSWKGQVNLDKGIHDQLPPPEVGALSEQFPFTEGSVIESFTFDEIYDNGSSMKDADAVRTDEGSLWQLPSGIGSSFAAEDGFQQNDKSLEEAINCPLLIAQSSSLSDILKESFKKSDSFTRWMNKELGEVDDSQIKSSSGVYWTSEETDNIIEVSSQDQFTVDPVLAEKQLFSICDISPSSTYAGSKTRVIISGRFLNSNEVKRRKWSCMFGEVEVPAEVLADGTLRCFSPSHKPGRVPFYVTCSNRLACSEVREFEFRSSDSQYMDAPNPHVATNITYLQMRLDNLLSLGQDKYQATVSNITKDMVDFSKKINSLMADNDSWSELLKLTDDNGLVNYDEHDQDAHGWTALHWAAFCG
ncbi:hypothetical protein U9M48_006399, partial [Paspalum notatum var. saurae]